MRLIREYDLGQSSKTILFFMLGYEFDGASTPYDPDDFSRCYTIVNMNPKWKKRLPALAKKYPQYKPYVEVWDKLEALWIKEAPKRKCPRLYKAMQKCVAKANKIKIKYSSNVDMIGRKPCG